MKHNLNISLSGVLKNKFVLRNTILAITSLTSVAFLFFVMIGGNKNFAVNQNNITLDNAGYWHPAMTVKPKKYWTCVDVANYPDNNRIDDKKGLVNHLLAQSIAGLTNRAVEQGKSEIDVWFSTAPNLNSYKLAKSALHNMGILEQGVISARELAFKTFDDADGIKITVKDLFKGYVLTDVVNNPESGIVASTASHVYSALIVDKSIEQEFIDKGYKKLYNATKKTTAGAWAEFKDKCNNKALVIMPVQTGQLRDFAIANNLFVVNLNKKKGDATAGQNTSLFREILAWIKPNSPVYGWESGVGENVFVSRVSAHGNMMIPYDWAYNTNLTSILYKERQPGKVKSINPKLIDYDEANMRYVSFYLTDGDNVQWMMNYFDDYYYQHPDADDVRMSFGLPVDNLSMIAPDQCQALFDSQNADCSIVQTFSGGYNYIDNFGIEGNRAQILRKNANSMAAHTKRHGVKVLAVMAKNVKSEAAQEGYKAYIEANNELVGIVAVQFAPYSGGCGKIMWFKNKDGYDIPVITVRYSIWDFGKRNQEYQGHPLYIADKLNADVSQNPYNLIAVHAWSRFNNKIYGAGAARMCLDKLNKNYKAVNVEELIWRIRMQYKAKQTEKYLTRLK